MKILFLDVDGVLNCASYFKTRKMPRDYQPRDMDPYRVLLVHRICEKTGAKVVVSSSWRLSEEALGQVKQAVEPHYIGKTPRHDHFDDRHAEIREWLEWKEHPEIERYAILDDDNCAGVGHGDNFFKTQWSIPELPLGTQEGLTDEIAAKIIEHLNV
jgi:hypothetical protein